MALDLWAARRPAGARLTLITDRRETLYSGMIPGLVAGEYDRRDAVIDARRLATRAGAELVVDAVTAVDAFHRRLHLAGGGLVPYDVASLDVGSTTRGSAGGGEGRASGEPTGQSVVDARDFDAIERWLGERPSGSGPQRATRRSDPSAEVASVVVVGGGAAGIELASCLRARLAGSGGGDRGSGTLPVRVILVEMGDRLMAGYAERVSRRARAALDERGVEVRLGTAVSRIEAPGGPEGHLTVRATGAAAPPFLRRSGLPVDDDGFVRVDGCLRVVGHPTLFAVGDCASLEGRDVPKAGVHAVREAPVLFRNLVAASRPPAPSGPEPERYEPQSDFLTLLNLGDGTALGTKWGLVVEGRWVRWIKDLIDRRFVSRLAREGSPGYHARSTGSPGSVSE